MAGAIYDKSLDFAVKMLGLSKELRQLKEFELASQILRSGTAIGANIAEAKYAQSNKDFVSKMAIARKEANETMYWLTLLVKSETLQSETLRPLAGELNQLIKILTSIILTSEAKNKKQGTSDYS